MPRFVILIGEKYHWLIKKQGFIVRSIRKEHRYTSELTSGCQRRMRNKDEAYNDFAGRR
jgi:hypothetical protein